MNVNFVFALKCPNMGRRLNGDPFGLQPQVRKYVRLRGHRRALSYYARWLSVKIPL